MLTAGWNVPSREIKNTLSEMSGIYIGIVNFSNKEACIGEPTQTRVSSQFEPVGFGTHLLSFKTNRLLVQAALREAVHAVVKSLAFDTRDQRKSSVHGDCEGSFSFFHL
jgi:hypothetical protein